MSPGDRKAPDGLPEHPPLGATHLKTKTSRSLRPLALRAARPWARQRARAERLFAAPLSATSKSTKAPQTDPVRLTDPFALFGGTYKGETGGWTT